MVWPAWIVSALAHPDVRRMGIEAATKAGSMLAGRLGKRQNDNNDTEILPSLNEEQPSDAELLREERVQRLRGTIVLIAIAQFVAIAIVLTILH